MPVTSKPSLRWEVILDGAVRKYPDGREVCCDTRKGREEYRSRILDMMGRQSRMCGIDPSHAIHNPTFEHSQGRGSGGSRRDDRIEDENGRPMNCAACLHCNSQKGSNRG